MASTTRVSKSNASENPKPATKVNVFHQRLGSMTVHQACKVLGDDGSKRLAKGAQAFEILADRDVFLGGDLLRIFVPDASLPSGKAIVTFTLQSNRAKQLQINCRRRVGHEQRRRLGRDADGHC